MIADPEVTHFIGGVITRADAWRYMASTIGHWALRSFVAWAVERKRDAKLLGRIGLMYPEGWPGLELVWTLGRSYWGYGYATEAAKASLRFASEQTSVSKLISLIDPRNLASQKVVRRIGEINVGKTSISIFGKSFDVDVREISRDQWIAL